MNSLPKLNELSAAIMKDCYNFLDQNSDEFTKKAINDILKNVDIKDEIIRKSYIVLCSVNSFETINDKDKSIYSFTKEYIEDVFDNLSSKNEKLNNIASYIDYFKAYLVMFCYKYLYNFVKEEDFLQFSFQNYENFSKLLYEYNISEIIKKYYEENVKLLDKEKSNELLNKWIQKLKCNLINVPDLNQKEEDQDKDIKKIELKETIGYEITEKYIKLEENFQLLEKQML